FHHAASHYHSSTAPLAQSHFSRRRLTRRPRPSVYGHDFLGATIATIVSRTGNRVHLQLAPGPSAGTGRAVARTIQGPFFRGPLHHRHQVRPVRVGTEPDQISSKASRTINAMTN